MRDYNSQTDRGIVAAAVRRVGLAGGFLSACRSDLAASGVRWPADFNRDTSEPTKALSADIDTAVAELAASTRGSTCNC